MSSASAFSGGVFVTPVPNAPFSAEVDQSITQVLHDGSYFERKNIALIARDGPGRIHNERHEILPASSTEKPRIISVHIYDPETRLNTFLNPYTHIARQNITPQPPSTEPPMNGWLHLKSPISSMPNLQVQDLGTNVIEGLEVHGYKRAVTIPAKASGTDHPVVVYDEIWYSEDLHINLQTRQYDPRIGSLTLTVTNISVGEPDAELFAIPIDYKLVDMTPPELEARVPGRAIGGVLGFGSQRAMAQASPPGPQSPQAVPVDSPAGSISGHVYRADTGAPLAGVVLTLDLTRWKEPPSGPPPPSPAARSGPDGAYAFSSLEVGNYTVQVWPCGGFLTPQPAIRRAIVAAAEATHDIDFRLQPAAAISGSVHDLDGDPLPKMAVSVFCPNANLNPATVAYPGYDQTEAITDDRGNYRVFGIPSGQCYIAVSAHRPFRGPPIRGKFYPNADSMETAQPLDVKPGEEIAHIDFHVPLTITGTPGLLRPGKRFLPPPVPGPAMGSVSGHVYRADNGAPIAEAIIHLNRHLDRDQIDGDAPVPSSLAARTETDGAYTFPVVEPGDYSVRLEHQGFAPMTEEGPKESEPHPSQISIATGQHLGNLDYKLQPTGAISGSVRDQDGVPLQGLFVTAFCSSPGSPGAVRADTGRATTDDRGDFRIAGIIPGECDIGAGPPSSSPLSTVGYRGVFYPNAVTMESAQPIPVKTDGDASGISLVVRYSPAYTITVKVVENGNASGERRYSVGLMSTNPAARPLVNTIGFGAADVMANAEGVGVLRGVTAGTYQIYLHPLRKLAGARGPTLRRPDGTIDTRGPREYQAWTAGGPAVASAVFRVVDRDVCIQMALPGFPPSPVQAGPQAEVKNCQTATETASVSENQREGCAVLPYEGKWPEDRVPPDSAFRGGMLCRYVINPKLPLFTCRFLAEGDNPLGKIEISEGENTKVIQTILSSGNPLSGGIPDPLQILVPVDANFDGYNDLPLLNGCGAVGNCSYDFYLYDPATHQFVFNGFLSGLIGPEVHPVDKTVTSFHHMSAGDGSSATYQYRNGQYVLIEQEDTSWDRENDIITKKTYELRHGEMELTKCEGECPKK